MIQPFLRYQSERISMFRRISMYFGSINHQDNSCPGFPAAKSGTAALLMVFQGVAGATMVHPANFSQKDWKTNFRSSISNRPKTFSFSEVLRKLLDRLSLEGQR